MHAGRGVLRLLPEVIIITITVVQGLLEIRALPFFKSLYFL